MKIQSTERVFIDRPGVHRGRRRQGRQRRGKGSFALFYFTNN